MNAMVPVPGETPGDWWDTTGSEKARKAAARRGGYGTDLDFMQYFFHDVPKKITREAAAYDAREDGSVNGLDHPGKTS